MSIFGRIQPSIQLRLVAALTFGPSRLQEFACKCANIAEGIGIIFKSADEYIVLGGYVRIAALLEKNELVEEKLVVGIALLSEKRTPHVGQSFALDLPQNAE